MLSTGLNAETALAVHGLLGRLNDVLKINLQSIGIGISVSDDLNHSMNLNRKSKAQVMVAPNENANP